MEVSNIISQIYPIP